VRRLAAGNPWNHPDFSAGQRDFFHARDPLVTRGIAGVGAMQAGPALAAQLKEWQVQ
jgi:hypothetical protein